MTDLEINLDIGSTRLKMLFDTDSPVHVSMLNEFQKFGAYEPGSTQFFGRVLRSGDAFIDIGAHIGYFSLLAHALVGETGHVTAVEPVDENHARLMHNLGLNGLDARTDVFKGVISGASGTVDLHLNKDNDGGHALWDPGLHPANVQSRADPETIAVPSMTLSAVFDRTGRDHIRLMKIDTEGAEQQIFESGADRLRDGVVDFIIAEVNGGALANMGSGEEDFLTFARSLGYVICVPDDTGAPPRLLTSTNRPDPRYVYNVILVRPEALETL